jgi:hypothetical protein
MLVFTSLTVLGTNRKSVEKSEPTHIIGKALKNLDIQRTRYYTAFGVVQASFLLGSARSVSLALSPCLVESAYRKELTDIKMLFLGTQNLFLST